MKILQFIETGGPGGAEKVVSLLSNELKDQGHEVIVATLREGWLTQEIDRLNISRTKFDSKSSFDFGLIFKIVELCRREKIEVIHSHLLDSNFYCSLASLISGIPLIATEHGDIHHLSKKKFAKLKVRTISILARHFTAVSNYTRTAIIASGGSSKKVKLVRNPIILSNASEELTALDPKIKDGDWIWAHVANFRPVKDQRTLLEGFSKALKSSTKGQKLLLMGDGQLKGELIEICQDLEITDDVIFLGFRKDVENILAACDGFILSSLSEAMPISLLEAMYSKLVVVCTKVGGIPEIVEDQVNGYLFEPKNSDYLAKILVKILSQEKSLNTTITENAKEKVSKEFNIKKITSEFLDLYKKRV